MPQQPQPVILIVRPAAQAAADAAVCEAAGWRAVPFSPIEIVPDQAALARLNAQFQAADAVFWVSPTAVATAAPHIVFSDGLIPQITVGRGSRKALAEYYPHTIYCPETGNDSEAVLELPVWQTLPQGAKILIVRGHGGRALLADTLRGRGFNPTFAEVYFRRPQALDWRVFETEKPQAAYITSAQMVRLLFAQVPPRLAQALRTLLYFTHHPRIAAALHEAGAENIETVAGLGTAVSHLRLTRSS